MLSSLVPLVLVLVLLVPTTVGAAVVLDQAFDNCSSCTSSLSAALGEGFSHTAQTVTAGVSGDLVRVDLHVQRGANFLTPWELLIIEAPAGIPNGNVLTAQLVDLPIVAAFSAFELAAPVHFNAGDSFAIALHPQGVNGVSPQLDAGSWGGGTGDPYSGGRLLFGTASDHIFPPESVDPLCVPLVGCLGWDLFFRTYVEVSAPVSAPATIFILVVGFALIGRWRRSQRAG